jgi:glyoxylase-like metal-dependent hydrolase (beta-lactamase superfamily II)
MLQVSRLCFNPLHEFTHIIFDTETNKAIIVDPGCSNEEEQKTFVQCINDNHMIPVMIVNTHCHVDHIFGNAFVKEYYNIPLYIHEKELEVLNAAPKFYKDYGFESYIHSQPDHFFQGETDTITLGNNDITIWHIPGHSAGHIALINLENKFCIDGDVLFKKRIKGRTDLPTGNKDELEASINRLLTLPKDTVLYPGHSQITTIGEE